MRGHSYVIDPYFSMRSEKPPNKDKDNKESVYTAIHTHLVWFRKSFNMD